MPLPWNKSKSNRISRIVADLQPPSRATSLVVETGFPASVVDLFVKNRDRIKRHSLKIKSKHHNKHHYPLHGSHQPLAPPPPPTPSLTPNDSPRLPSAAVEVLDDLLVENSDLELNVVNNATVNRTFSMFVMKMLLAVVPVLSSVKLAICIVFFAFLLEMLGLIVPRFFDISSIQNRLRSTNNADAELEIQPIIINSDEIQIAESNSDQEQLVLSESFREIEIGCSSDLGMEIEEEGKLEVEKNERSKRSKLRAKIIKKLIPKKLRKKKKNKMSTMRMENEQVTESSCDEEREEDEVIWEPEEEEEEEGIGSSTMGKGEEEQEQKQRKMNLESEFVIVMILLGLCGSRFLALVFAISGCFLFKFCFTNGNLG